MLNASLVGIRRWHNTALWLLRFAALIGGAECKAWKARSRYRKVEPAC